MSQCPHHNFTEESLLSTLYRGVLPRTRIRLDIASNGSFLSRDVESGWELLKNMVVADGTYEEDFDRSHRGPSEPNPISQKQLDALNAKLDKLLSVDYEDKAGATEKVCYMRNQGMYQQQQGNFKPNQGTFNPYKPNPNLPHTSKNVVNPQQHPHAPLPLQEHHYTSQLSDLTTSLQQMIKGQDSLLATIKTIQTDFTTKFELLSSRLQHVEDRQTSLEQLSSRLPATPIQNPKEYTVKSITLKSGRELPIRTTINPITEDGDVQEGEDNIIIDAVEQNTTIPPAPLPHCESRQVLPAPYKPQLPFPQRFKKEDVVKDRTQKLEGMAFLTHGISAIIQETVVKKKLEDPGTFTIPCSLGQSSFNNCLCDLGASISLMPLSVAKRLGYDNFTPCTISVTLADKSTRSPHGLLEDMPVRIGNVEVPTDFVVLDMVEDKETPLLLGRPFLASIGALINVKSGTIELDIGTHSKMTFDINDAMGKPTIGGQTFSVKGLDQLNIKPLKRPHVVMGRSSKASDYHHQTSMYEAVIDGQSLSSLFNDSDAAHSPPGEVYKVPAPDFGPDIILAPLGYVNGAMEYRVRGTSRFRPFAKVRQLLSRSKPHPELAGPFEVKTVMPCGAITLVGKKGDMVPMDGQKVKLYLVAETERTPPPLPKPPI